MHMIHTSAHTHTHTNFILCAYCATCTHEHTHTHIHKRLLFLRLFPLPPPHHPTPPLSLDFPHVICRLSQGHLQPPLSLLDLQLKQFRPSMDFLFIFFRRRIMRRVLKETQEPLKISRNCNLLFCYLFSSLFSFFVFCGMHTSSTVLFLQRGGGRTLHQWRLCCV